MIRVVTQTIEREPVKAPCSLLPECVVEPGKGDDYQALAPYHYRDTGFPPAVHQIYRARHVPSRRTVGVIVYAAPAMNLGVRNRIFGERYKIGGGVDNKAAFGRLNGEVELIMRIVIHPTFRGIALGQRLIAETIVVRPYRYIEMSAAMGNINPFAAKAGMRRVEIPRPTNTQRMLAALRSVGMTDDQIGNPSDLLLAVTRLDPAKRAFIEKELIFYATRWLKSRTGRKVTITLEDAAGRVASNALLQAVYYLHENPGVALTS